MASSKDAEKLSSQPAPQPMGQAPSVPPKSGQKLDETIPGGSFRRSDGKLVNAEGQRIHEDGTLLTAEEVAVEGA